MSEEFSAALRRHFKASRGAYSPVTQDERNKSQITFVGAEQELAEDFFGAELDERHGSIDTIRAKGLDPDLPYRKWPSGREIGLTTSYKTGKPRELRLYLRTDQFKPEAGWYWGVFEREGCLWLCEFSADMLEKIESGALEVDNGRSHLEGEEDDFQESLNSEPPPGKALVQQWKYGRSRAAALSALNKAGFRCELFPQYPTFQARGANRAFMEAHHLIPIKLQGQLGVNLDVPANICCLNPFSHRMMHHGRFVDFEAELANIVRGRLAFIQSCGWISDDVMGLYS